MTESANNLECRQDPSGEQVAQEGEKKDCPGKQCSMPELRSVVGVVLDNKALDDSSFEESDLSTSCDPGENLVLLHNNAVQMIGGNIHRDPS